MSSRSLGHRAPLLWLVLPLMAGLAAGKFGDVAPVSWLLGGALVAAVGANFAAWRAVRWWAPAIGAALFLAGNASYPLHRARLPAWEGLPPREVRVALRVNRVFAQTDARRAAGSRPSCAPRSICANSRGSGFIFRSRCAGAKRRRRAAR